ncbi:MAG: 2Fe-2S iron-sulfur cluster-binding protein [Sulfitobacter sp.]
MGSRIFLRSLRIATGLYLLAYITSHLINLSLGLISIETMDAARPYLSGIWGGSITRNVLAAALLIHYGIGLWSIYARPSISGTAQDVVQALSGLAIIPLMAIHSVGVIMLQNASVEVDYNLILRVFWISNPGYGLMQVMLISAAWVHGCAGLFMWLRAKPGVVRLLPWLYPLAVAVPVLALLGFTEAGRVVLIERVGPVVVQTPGAYGETLAEVPYALIMQVQAWVMWGSLAIGIAVVLARWTRNTVAKPAVVHIKTQGVGAITGQSGKTLLDAFRAQNQPHANLCSGRGRCGTCAVRVLSSQIDLPTATPLEQATLDRIGKGGNVRLACQLPLVHGGTITVERVLPPDFSFESIRERKTESKEEVPA